ncbi:MAG: Psg1 family protein [bacterium]|nr:Psg1 family protein [bacterium]
MKRIFSLAVSLIIVLAMLVPQIAEAGGGVMVVTLASDTPGSRDVVAGETGLIALKANFEARENLTIKTVKVRAFSVPINNGLVTGEATPAQASDVTNVRLRAKGVSLTTSKALSADGSVDFSGADWGIAEPTIPQNATESIEILFDLPNTCKATGLYFVIDGADIQLSLSSGGAQIPAVGKAQGTYMAVKQQGFLSVYLAPDTPPSQIVTTGSANTIFLKADFIASGEAVSVSELNIRRYGGDDKDLSNISLWDGPKQLGANQQLIDDSITFRFPADSRWELPKGTKTLTVKADIAEIASGAASGHMVMLGLPKDGIKATGKVSGRIIAPEAPQVVLFSPMIIRKSFPTLASATLPSTTLTMGEKVLYRWTITADKKGDISWKSIAFQISGIKLGMEGPLKIGSMTIYQIKDGQPIAANSKAWSWPNDVNVQTFSAIENQTIPAGTTATYELRGTITGEIKSGDTISTKIPSGDVIPDNPYIDRASFVWNDGVASATDYLVTGIPTASVTLEKPSNPPPTPSVTFLYPNGGETFNPGERVLVKYSTHNFPRAVTVQIQLNKGAVYPNGPFNPIGQATNYIPDTGSYAFTIPLNAVPGNDYSFMINADYPTTETSASFHSNNFSIASSTASPSITVLSPNGGERWEIGKTYRITWQSQGIKTVAIYVYNDTIFGSGSTNYLDRERKSLSVPANQGYFDWTIDGIWIPKGDENRYKISIGSADSGVTARDTSDNYFSIVAPIASPITILSPNGGETLLAGKPIPFSWRWSGKEAPLAPAIYLYSVEKGQIIYGSLSDIQYNPKSDIQTGNFNALAGWHLVNGKPDGYPPDFIPGGRYKIKIAEYPESTNNPSYPKDPPRFDYSDNSFIINVPAPSITVLSPNGGEKWIQGQTYNVTWKSSGIDKIDISLDDYRAGPSDVMRVTNISASLGSYSLTLPANNPRITPGNAYQIQIIAPKEGISDASDKYFNIVAPPTQQPVLINFWFPGTAKADSDWIVEIGIGRIEHLNATQYIVEFNPSVLRLDKVEPGRVGSIMLPISYQKELAPGKHLIIQGLPPENPEATGGDGLLAKLTFHVVGPPKSRTELRLSNGTLSNWQTGKAIEAYWPVTTIEVTALLGDVNNDGAVNILDYTKLLRIIIGLDPAVPAADINGDGKVNIADLVQLLKTISG